MHGNLHWLVQLQFSNIVVNDNCDILILVSFTVINKLLCFYNLSGLHINVMSKNKEVDFCSEKNIAIKNTAGAFELLNAPAVNIQII